MEEKAGTRVLMMGNEAIARGAVEAGIAVAASYPGTPSSEIMGTLAQWAKKYGFHAEWSVNEKVAVETAAGASYAGARAMASMKQMGLNVASDAVMSLAYIGIEGGLVLVVADDPGPHSSQTEQDTRLFASFAKLPILEPSSAQEAKDMTIYAFEVSEALKLPVIVRPTTRSSHAHGDVVLGEIKTPVVKDYKFQKDPKWCILPSLSARNHFRLEDQQVQAAKIFSQSAFNWIEAGEGNWGVIASGVSYNYAREALDQLGYKAPLLKIGTPYPLPDEPTREFLKKVDKVLVIEEQEPVIEDQVVRLVWNEKLGVEVYGKRTGEVSRFGEFDVDRAASFIQAFLGQELKTAEKITEKAAPTLPGRPPILCAGCGHRAAFYAFAKAGAKGDAVFCGDIGCYTLGYAAPLHATDTCLCMGGGLTVAYGLSLVEKERPHVAIIGDSTFLHAGMTGLLNIVYNQGNVTVVILDNETTAMTGHQPHPGMGKAATGDDAPKAEIEKIVESLGVTHLEIVDPNNLPEMMAAAKRALDFKGPSVVIARAPCVNRIKITRRFTIDKDLCTECEICIEELGCPAIINMDGVEIADTCAGCGVCCEICPSEAIKEVSQ
ncbi:MAG: indolepyruvate ferredoxin oxidoreductase subunit alpha [Bacillota bacterium]